MAGMELLSCPFCDFADADEYFLMQHVELIHPENGESPFIARDFSKDTEVSNKENRNGEDTPPTDGSEEDYVNCPEGCGESVLATELPSHLDLHMAEGIALEDGDSPTMEETTVASEEERDHSLADANFSTNLPRQLRNRQQLSGAKSPKHTFESSRPRKKASLMDKIKAIADGEPARVSKTDEVRTQRLGRSELGPHAFEKEMPAWLRELLEHSSKPKISNNIGPDGSLIRVERVVNETADIIPVLVQLCEQDKSVEQVFFCNSAVCHVAKIDKEGGFCGYRNLQMLISYLRGAQAEGCDHFASGSPSIFRLQDLIENAWDSGFNEHGRIETGGIRGTRKYIGTPEAQALFGFLGISCRPVVVSNDGGDRSGTKAVKNLIEVVHEYFLSGWGAEDLAKVNGTFMPPIYFQHKGHSLTIVGIEIKKNGAVNLLVFDPMFKVSPGVTRLLGKRFTSEYPHRLLQAYRRGEGYLKKYGRFNFELLKLSSPYEIWSD